MFPKKLSINSTKTIKRKEKTFWWDIKKKTHYQNTYYKKNLKKKLSTLIRVIRKNKNSLREREREIERVSTHSFVWEKYELNEKTISNLYKIKWVEEEANYKKKRKEV